MDKLVISGGKPLKGKVAISGAKNAIVPLMASRLLCEGGHQFENVPQLRDIRTFCTLLDYMGANVDCSETLRIDTSNVKRLEAPYDLVKTMRASVLVLGPLVSRFRKARVSLPGGCAIGARPINLHIKGLEALGVDIQLKHGYVEANARKLTGSHIYLDLVTVTGTENLMMAATMADGTTVLENAAKEPEVVDLANYLNSLGARISGAGSHIITIEGVKELKTSKPYQAIPDRIEAGTLLIAAGITGGEVTITNCIPSHLESIIHKLQETGMTFDIGGSWVTARSSDPILSTDVKTLPFPGFPTDMQAQFMALMCLGNGTSVITEQIFENRFMHVSELRRLGADISIDGRTAVVKGVKELLGAKVMATDLRASASLVLAGLAAKGITEVSRVYHLDRGYDRLERKLSALGAEIERTKE